MTLLRSLFRRVPPPSTHCRGCGEPLAGSGCLACAVATLMRTTPSKILGRVRVKPAETRLTIVR